MVDVDRNALSSEIFRRLESPDFRRLLTGVTPQGERPVVPAVRSDSLRDVLAQVRGLGGTGNVVVPWANGYIVLVIRFHSAVLTNDEAKTLNEDCTLGLLLARLMQDGENGQELTYWVANAETNATADLAGLAV